jgi:tRNA-dihydrouridine synthase A
MPVSRLAEIPVSVAPMMDWTDRHCRYFLRLISPRVRLYTEMITTAAVLHGDRERLLAYHPDEHPLALQLGGSEPEALAACAIEAQVRGFDEINLNVGCPSDRVQSGKFGACLMLEPERVADCVAAMRDAVSVPVSVKCRIGVDEHDSDADLDIFIRQLLDAGLKQVIIHARKAWLKGLSPKQNRDVPPLEYDRVYRVKQRYPELNVYINGGIRQPDDINTHLQHVDGVMIGREAYHNPWLLAELETCFDGVPALRSRHEVVRDMLPYIDDAITQGVKLQQISRHMLGLFQSQPGARAWRRYISEHAHLSGAGVEVLERALECVPAVDVDHPRAVTGSS